MMDKKSRENRVFFPVSPALFREDLKFFKSEVTKADGK